jgi:hypothetical protein
VNFVVDDSENEVYAAGDLKWKGSFLVDERTGRLTFDPFWSGAAYGAAPLSGWPTLYDDGPWTEGGHEPIGAVAGDHVWGVTVFATPPAYGAIRFEYGLIDVTYQARLGNGWIWKGANGSFFVAAGASAPIDAAGMAFPEFGQIDLGLAIDTRHLSPIHPWNASTVTVKSSQWGWGELPMRNLGGGIFFLALSGFVSEDELLPHTGLLNRGDTPEFVFVLGGQGYQVWTAGGGLVALTDGVTAGAKRCGSRSYDRLPIQISPSNGNTFVTIAGRPADARSEDECSDSFLDEAAVKPVWLRSLGGRRQP